MVFALNKIDWFMKSWVLSSLLVKVASSCNLRCCYCYWFRDSHVKSLPKTIPSEVKEMFLCRLAHHIKKYNLKEFFISFHGGEPLLYNFYDFKDFLQKISDLSEKYDCKIRCSIQTNGILINKHWASLFKKFNLAVGISIDGPKKIHDLNRYNQKRKGSFDTVLSGITILQESGIDFGILAVANPLSEPSEVVDFFVNTLFVRDFDILLPDYNHDDKEAGRVVSVYIYYKKLFDVFCEFQKTTPIQIRLFKNILATVLGYQSSMDVIGYGPSTVITLEPDGQLNGADVLRINAPHGFKKANLISESLDSYKNNPLINWIISQSLTLSVKCQRCFLKFACGGGYFPHRYSSKTSDYQNPSIYCEDIKNIYKYIINKMVFLKIIEKNAQYNPYDKPLTDSLFS